MTSRRIDKGLASSFATLLLLSFVCPTVRGEALQNTAQSYIESFRGGAEFRPDDSVAGIVMNGQVVRLHFSVLTKELSSGSSHVRENIVKVLEKIGLELDTPSANKFQVIRDPAVIRALAVEGFAKDDSAADAAAGILRKKCMPADLASLNDVFTKSLEKGSGDYLYLAAKAKTVEASYVDRMARSPLWHENGEELNVVKVAQAALGNGEVEDKFINDVLDAAQNLPPAPRNRFYDVGDAKNGTEVASRMVFLGLIGTRKSLRVACAFLRSPLKSYVKNLYERSIRYDALDAIRYNFPDERILYKPTQLAEWVQAEKFCIEKLGVTFDGPTPELPFDLPYPHHLFPEPLGAPK